MKIRLITLIVLVITGGVIARVIVPFDGWNQLQDSSPCIVIARCGKPTVLSTNVMVVGRTKSDSEIQVLSILKGTNNTDLAYLQTDHELRQCENYLIFAYYHNGIYQANEEYRVIPLGINFSTNSIAAKSLDEQIQILLQHRLNNLNQQMKSEQEEKQRLEAGIRNP